MPDETPTPTETPQVSPEAKPAESTDIPVLDRKTTIVTGTGKEVPLGDMEEAWTKLQQLQQQQQQPQAPALSQEEMEEFSLYQKAVKQNDQDAAAKLWDRYRPQPQPTPEEAQKTKDQQIADLSEKVEKLTQVVTQHDQVANMVTHQRGEAIVTRMLDQAKDQYPYLSSHPSAVSMVTSKLNEFQQLAQMRGMDLRSTTDEFRSKAVHMAFDNVNNHLKNTFDFYSAHPIAQPNGQEAKPITAVDDQSTPDKVRQREGFAGLSPSKVQRAMLSVDNEGYLVDKRSGKRILDPQGATMVPTQPVQPPTGAAPGIEPEQPQGPYPEGGLLEKMRSKLEEL